MKRKHYTIVGIGEVCIPDELFAEYFLMVFHVFGEHHIAMITKITECDGCCNAWNPLAVITGTNMEDARQEMQRIKNMEGVVCTKDE